jgi:hypothetical protein
VSREGSRPARSDPRGRQPAQHVLAPPPSSPVRALSRPPTFSIVIAAHQSASTVAGAVASALAQVHPAHEVIVVDDGSTDGTAAALEPVADRIRLLQKPHGGVASARNAALAAATGDFVAILDADDAYHPDRLLALARLACERPDLDLITTDALFVVGGAPAGTFLAHNPFATAGQRTAILRSCFVGGWPAVRRARLAQLGGFDESLRTGSDWDCWLRLILSGSSAGLVAEPLYEYRVHSGSLTARRTASLWDRVRLLEKAAVNPALLAHERPALLSSLRAHRIRAARAEVKSILFDSIPEPPATRRRRLRQLALLRGVDLTTRLLAALALLLPRVARGRLTPEESLEARLAGTAR